MRKHISAFIGVFFIPLFAFCQYWEFGTFIGGSNYSGDLASDAIETSETNIAFGGLVRYNLNRYWTLKGNIYYGTLTGSDERNGGTEARINRNLDFRSKIIDIGGNIEWNIMGIEYGYDRNRFSPYLFTGFSVFGFDPEGTRQINGVTSDEWVRLQPLGTEGQETTEFNDRRKYALTQVSIPFGAGLKYNLWGPINVGMEMGLRKTFTDYIDDVSSTYVPNEVLRRQHGQLAADMGNKSLFVDGEKKIRSVEVTSNVNELVPRGNPDNKDWYMFGGITITYAILPAKCFKF